MSSNAVASSSEADERGHPGAGGDSADADGAEDPVIMAYRSERRALRRLQSLRRSVESEARRCVLAASRFAVLVERACVRHAVVSPRCRVFGTLGCLTELWPAEAGGDRAAAAAFAGQREWGIGAIVQACHVASADAARAAEDPDRRARAMEAGPVGSVAQYLALIGLRHRALVGPYARAAAGAADSDAEEGTSVRAAGSGGAGASGMVEDEAEDLHADALTGQELEAATARIAVIRIPPPESQASLLQSFLGLLVAALDGSVDRMAGSVSESGVLASAPIGKNLHAVLGSGVRTVTAIGSGAAATAAAQAASTAANAAASVPSVRFQAPAAVSGPTTRTSSQQHTTHPHPDGAHSTEHGVASTQAHGHSHGHSHGHVRAAAADADGLMILRTGVTALSARRVLRVAARCITADGSTHGLAAIIHATSATVPDVATICGVLRGATRPTGIQPGDELGAKRRRRNSVMRLALGRSSSATRLAGAVRRMSVAGQRTNDSRNPATGLQSPNRAASAPPRVPLEFVPLHSLAVARNVAVQRAAARHGDETLVGSPDSAQVAEAAEAVRSTIARLQQTCMNLGGVVDADAALELLLYVRMACAAANSDVIR